jgi:hypothetical protein
MLSDAPMCAAPMASSENVLVFPDAYRVWDDSAATYDVLDESEGLPDGN